MLHTFFSKKTTLLFFVIVVVFGAGYFLGIQNVTTAKDEDSISLNSIAETREKGYKFISPLLDCQESKAVIPGNIKTLRDEVQNYILDLKTKQSIKEASVYFRDLSNGPWFGINEKSDFAPASLLKVHILIAVLKKAQSDPSYLQQMVLNEERIDDGFTQDIVPSTPLKEGEKYSIWQLVQQMIFESDNQAKNLLMATLSQEELEKAYVDFGLRNPFADPTQNDVNMTVAEYSSFFRILYNSSYLSKQMSEVALDLLSRSEYKDGLVASVPKGITIAHKFGEREDDGTKQLHDCGIVYYPGKPFLLCVMTRGDDWNSLTNTIQHITRMVVQTVAQEKAK